MGRFFSSKKNAGFFVSTLLMGVMIVSYQNFVTPTSGSTIDILSRLDPRFASTISDIDFRYMSYAAGFRTCSGRTAELEVEHKKMKADLLKVASFLNQSLNSFGTEIANAPESFPALLKIIEKPNRKTLHMLGFYETQGRSVAPVRVQITGSGSTDLFLYSFESVNWMINDPNRLVNKIYLSSYKESFVNGIPGVEVERVPYKSSSFVSEYAQIAVDNLMRSRLSMGHLCDDYKLASFQGSYSASTVNSYNVFVNSGPIKPPPVLTARLFVSVNGGPLTNVGEYTKDAAYDYCKIMSVSNPSLSYKCEWNGSVIFESKAQPPPPPPPVLTARLFVSVNGGPLTNWGEYTKDAAYDYCKSKSISNPSLSYKCEWNGSVIFESKAQPPPPPPPVLTARLFVSVNGGPLTNWGDYTKEKAYDYCKSKSISNPSLSYKCEWNGSVIFESKAQPPPPPPPPPVLTARLFVSVNGGPLTNWGEYTKDAAYDYCKSKSISNPSLSYKCEWNGSVIFESKAQPPPPPPPVLTARLFVSVNGGPLTNWGDYTKEKAYDYCKSKSISNPSLSYKCEWNGSVIFESKP